MADYIDRDAALASIDAALNNATGDLYDAYVAIRALPAVTVGVKPLVWEPLRIAGFGAYDDLFKVAVYAATEGEKAEVENTRATRIRAALEPTDAVNPAAIRAAALREVADMFGPIVRDAILALIDKEPGNG